MKFFAITHFTDDGDTIPIEIEASSRPNLSDIQRSLSQSYPKYGPRVLAIYPEAEFPGLENLGF